MKQTPKIRTVFLVCFISLIFISCSEKDPYVFGFVGSLSGPNADLGTSGRNGVLLAFEEFNESGGVNGRPLELVIKDHQMDSGQLSHLSRIFADAGAELVIGPFTSVMTKAMLPMAEAQNLLLISPTASSTEFYNVDDNLIRMNSTTMENTLYYAKYLVQKAELMSCAVLYDIQNESFTGNWLSNFSDNYEELGGRVDSIDYINSKIDINFQSELETVLNSGAEALLIVANSIDSATLVQQLRQMNDTFPVFVSEWAGTTQFIELGGRAVENVMVLQSFDPFDESDLYKDFRNRYMERFHDEPSFAAVLSHDACHVLFQALVSQTEGQSLKSAIFENGPYQGVQESISINAFGDATRNAVFSVVENGKFRKIE